MSTETLYSSVYRICRKTRWEPAVAWNARKKTRERPYEYSVIIILIFCPAHGVCQVLQDTLQRSGHSSLKKNMFRLSARNLERKIEARFCRRPWERQQNWLNRERNVLQWETRSLFWRVVTVEKLCSVEYKNYRSSSVFYLAS